MNKTQFHIFRDISSIFYWQNQSLYQVLSDSKGNIATVQQFYVRFSTNLESCFGIVFNISAWLERLITFRTPDTYVFNGTGLFNVKFGMVSHDREPQYHGSIAVLREWYCRSLLFADFPTLPAGSWFSCNKNKCVCVYFQTGITLIVQSRQWLGNLTRFSENGHEMLLCLNGATLLCLLQSRRILP